MVKRVYDISLNSLGVRSQEPGVRSQEGRKTEEIGLEGESFLVA
ncbi:hypothetical protein [Okeania sp. SIO2B3]|nr:hypothetical protein [Okeania sp. SIO2B3]